MAISMIERRSAWYDIYDERGKKQKHSAKVSVKYLAGLLIFSL